MIIFSTVFNVKKELTKEKFIQLALDWINQSPHYNFSTLKWNNEEIYEKEVEKQKFSIINSSNEMIIAIRLENIDEKNVLWTSDFVLEEKEKNNILVVRLARDAMDKETVVNSGYNRPRLMKSIIKMGYGDFDNGLPISEKCITITDKDLEMAKSIIMGDGKFSLPIVYVTKTFFADDYALDVNELAKDLAGTAHVLVEDNTKITSELKKETEGKNPFNGAVHIYFSDTLGLRLLPEDFMDANVFRYKVVNAVCRRLSLIKLDDKYSWSTIKYGRLLHEYSKGKKESFELEKTCEELIQLKEKESSQLITDLQNEIAELRIKNQNYEYAFQNNKKLSQAALSIEFTETEFYEGEIKDLILEILMEEMKKMEDDPNQVGWRKYHVLKNINDYNKKIGNGARLSCELKEILSKIGKINAKDKKRLRELGFVLDSNDHNKLYFHNDHRYYITLGKTPSDHRAADNAASVTINTIVCSGR
jgi:hypothetical protein